MCIRLGLTELMAVMYDYPIGWVLEFPFLTSKQSFLIIPSVPVAAKIVRATERSLGSSAIEAIWEVIDARKRCSRLY